jgi:hypothetical protein
MFPGLLDAPLKLLIGMVPLARPLGLMLVLAGLPWRRRLASSRTP